MHFAGAEVVWFKRDLRVRDHRPLLNASRSGRPIVCLYVDEPELLHSDEWDERHSTFIKRPFEGSRCHRYQHGQDLQPEQAIARIKIPTECSSESGFSSSTSRRTGPLRHASPRCGRQSVLGAGRHVCTTNTEAAGAQTNRSTAAAPWTAGRSGSRVTLQGLRFALFSVGGDGPPRARQRTHRPSRPDGASGLLRQGCRSRPSR